MSSAPSKNIVIVGGGITGLSAAFYLQKEIRARKLPWKITLLESKQQLGGKIQTIVRDGYTMERGPDSFISRKPSAAQLVRDVGLESDLVRNEAGQAYILRHGQLLPIPEGAVMGVPTEIKPFVTTSLLSPIGKMRAAADLLLPASKMLEEEDQSVGTFFRQRLGNEVVENIIEPLLSGIYAGNIDQMSLMTTFPQFAQMGKEHRSLILGMKSSRPKKQTNQKPVGMFQTLKSGLSSLVHALELQLTDVDVKKGISVEKIVRDRDQYTLSLQNGERLTADSVILTTPHGFTRKILGNPDFLNPLHDRPTSVATAILAYPQDEITWDKEGTGFLVPRSEEGYSITACTWTNKKWPHTAPPGKTLLRCYVGRAGEEAIVDRNDEDIVGAVIQDIKKLSTITGEPEFSYVTRWRRAMPQFVPGHKTWYSNVQKQIRNQYPGLFLAGSSYAGSGIPDCIDQGKNAITDVIDYVSSISLSTAL
ncbi:oxygen-dependent protoporphyrinogen oxidase [Croceifilum oryzae]|uniref:Coproporphyrinogen III oxidase n=1 Tax=Croceifilum oryzae TaxID=1553429 RepID=A0AAJ1TIP4_9BACL|nr:protoporphyrinogen oxidase [Croceifilum oryzae]MDQ0416841.1 oxygen-dependent protoporphyrinogen oxidase [Croceifilum oryzae]